MQIISIVLSALGMVSMITATLMKGENMKKILFFVFCGNVLVATSYLVGGSGFNGAASCYIGSVQAIINYFFDSKGKSLPKWLIVVYAVSFISVNLIVGGFRPLTFLAITACMVFILCIGQKNGARYRRCTILNNSLWCLYAILSKSYGALATHIPIIIFSIAGIVIYDKKKNDNK